jgi:hypothetical protein
MAKKQKHVNDLTDREIANAFINYGTNQAYAAVYEVFQVAARLITKLEQVDPAELDPTKSHDQVAAFMHRSMKEVLQASGMRELLAATVKRYAFKNPFGEDDFDPDGTRSAAVAEIILQDAVWANAKADG